MSSHVKLGVVQPCTRWGDEEPRNLDEAIRYVAQGAALGVDLLAYPENYPGPYRAENRFDVVEPMRAAPPSTASRWRSGHRSSSSRGPAAAISPRC
jgi:predicted amidohydrolase